MATAMQREWQLSFSRDCYPFTKIDVLVSPDAKVVELVIPFSMYKPSMQTLDDFKDDPKNFATTNVYRTILHTFWYWMKTLGSGESKLPRADNARKCYSNALMQMEVLLVDSTASVHVLYDSDEEEAEEDKEADWTSRQYQILNKIDWATMIAEGKISALRFKLYNHTDKTFGRMLEVMIKTNQQRKKPETRKKIAAQVRAQRGEQISSATTDSVETWAHWSILSVSHWQRLVYAYLRGASEAMAIDDNNFSALQGDTVVNPEVAFSPIFACKLVPANTTREVTEIQRYMKIVQVPNPNYSEDDDEKDEEVEPYIQQMQHSVPFPQFTWMFEPQTYDTPELHRFSLAPFHLVTRDVRGITERHHHLVGTAEPDWSTESSVDQQTDNLNTQVDLMRKKTSINPEMLDAAVATLRFQHYSTKRTQANAKKRRRINGVQERIQADLEGAGQDVADDADPMVRREGGLDRLADRYAFDSERVPMRQALMDPAAARQRNIERKRRDYLPPDLSRVESTPVFAREGIVDMEYVASASGIVAVQSDHMPTVTVLDDLRAQVEKKVTEIDAETNPTVRERKLKELDRERLNNMAIAWSQSSKLCTVHRKLVRHVDEMLEEKMDLARRFERVKQRRIKAIKDYSGQLEGGVAVNPQLKREMEQIVIQRLGERADFKHLKPEELQHILTQLETDKPEPANLSTEWTYDVTNLSPVGQWHLDHIMDLERAAKCQHAHKATYQCRWNCMDAMRHGFNLHNNTLFTGPGMSSKSWVELTNSDMMPECCYTFGTHITTMANCTSGENNDIVTFLEEIPPALLDIEGNMGPGQSGNGEQNTKAGAIMKNQLTSCKNITHEFARTPEGFRTNRKSVQQCIGVIVGAMNRFVNRVGKAMMSRWIHVPMRQIQRDDRDILDVIMRNHKDPLFLEMQSRWQMEYIHKFITDKFIQAASIKEPTMFVAQVMLGNFYRALEKTGAVSKVVRGYEQLYNSIRNGTCAFACKMAYDSVLSRINHLNWKPQFHREITKWMYATEDMVIFFIGLYSDMFANPVEDQLYKMIHDYHTKTGLKQAMQSEKPSRQSTAAGAANFSGTDPSRIPDNNYWCLDFEEGDMKTTLRRLMGTRAHQAYGEDDLLGEIDKLTQRVIEVPVGPSYSMPLAGGAVLAAGSPAPASGGSSNGFAAQIDSRAHTRASIGGAAAAAAAAARPAPAAAAGEVKTRPIPVMQLKETQLLIAKTWLDAPATQKIREAAKVFSYNHAIPRKVLWGRNCEKVECEQLTDAKTGQKRSIVHPAFFEVIDVKRDPNHVLEYKNPSAMSKDMEAYFKRRYKSERMPGSSLFNIEDQMAHKQYRSTKIDRNLDLLGWHFHCLNNPTLLDPKKKSTQESYPPNTIKALLAKQEESGPFEKFVYPDSFILDDTEQSVSLTDLLPNLKVPAGMLPPEYDVPAAPVSHHRLQSLGPASMSVPKPPVEAKRSRRLEDFPAASLGMGLEASPPPSPVAFAPASSSSSSSSSSSDDDDDDDNEEEEDEKEESEDDSDSEEKDEKESKSSQSQREHDERARDSFSMDMPDDFDGLEMSRDDDEQTRLYAPHSELMSVS